MGSCFTCCCYSKKNDIKTPLITDIDYIVPSALETRVPFSKAEDNIHWNMYEDEVKVSDISYSNIDYLNRIAEAKELGKKLQGTYGFSAKLTPGRPLP
jgi:hypothetical protein